MRIVFACLALFTLGFLCAGGIQALHDSQRDQKIDQKTDRTLSLLESIDKTIRDILHPTQP